MDDSFGENGIILVGLFFNDVSVTVETLTE